SLYTAGRLGQINAFSPVENSETDVNLTPLWSLDLAQNGTPLLLPLPGGGVMAAVRTTLFAMSADGKLLWQEDIGARPFSYTLTADALFFATASGADEAVWQVRDGERPLQIADVSGKLAFADEQLWIYSARGVYRLNPATESPSAEQIYALPMGFPQQGDIMPLPAGGVLVIHTDLFDSRLLAFAPDGTLRQQRSLGGGPSAGHYLQMVNDQPYLITNTSLQNAGELTLFAIDLDAATLTHIFTGGSRMPITTDSWTAVFNNRLLLNIGGGHLAQIDVETAVQNSP
ncbi:MAG: hypothetical protein KC421_28095, partial [Anaerolineales bacterium]|nr:hypothetical protein [Anaerolineales bacterium]